MPTLATFKKSYPKLTQEQVKFLHTARAAALYSSWSLSKVRTIALNPFILDIPPSPEHTKIANLLLSTPQIKGIESDYLHYPRNRHADVLTISTPPATGIEGIDVLNPEWVASKTVTYHSDDIDSDAYAYAFWGLKSTAPMTLMLGGNAYSMPDGQLVIFDARIPHALVSSDASAMMIALLGTVSLTPQLREKLGIEFKRPSESSLSHIKKLERMEVDSATGYFAAPSI